MYNKSKNKLIEKKLSYPGIKQKLILLKTEMKKQKKEKLLCVAQKMTDY